MARGFLAGIIWGGVTGAVILGVSALVAERRVLSLPKPKASAVEVPAGSEFDQARAESDPVVPQAETRPSGEEVSGISVPLDDATETPPAFDTSSLEVPQPTTSGPDGLGDVPAVADEVDISVTGPGIDAGGGDREATTLGTPDTPAVAPETVTVAPKAGNQPEVEGDDGVIAAPSTTAPVQGSAPDVAETAAPDSPSVSSTDSAAAPSATTEPAQVTAPESESSPTGLAESDSAGGSFLVPVQEIGNLAPDVTTDRLPRIGSPGDTSDVTSSLPVIRQAPGQEPKVEDVPDQGEPDDGSQSVEGPDPSVVGALRAFRTPFSTDANLPLFAVVLVHQSEDTPDLDRLEVLPDFVAFAVDAGLRKASDIAAAYRAAGREVVLIPSLPAGATPQDVEVALQINFETVPEAVAVMDYSGAGFQSDRAAVAQIVDVVVDTGHGLITFPRGLNTARQRAEREGIPNALIFREIDGGGEDSEAIRRAMDRAAFRARQNEAVILVGGSSPITQDAILEWTLGSHAASVTLAPISAALLNEN